ncbi:beta-galactosidase domain 4-containing protein [Draconibacterium mangrovi]|uniref:beta-galactosidase domain 4-containing protein n=1 Tax=Draconibacterium mangrovi TaxID=2697469 RepID=UPI0013CFD1DB|nr:beta-galactosidase domain 4-containing protein [Draconibacterium mangrovi]
MLKPQSENTIELSTVLENPRLWSAEIPYFYQLKLKLKNNKDEVLEILDWKFGVRKIEANAEIILNVYARLKKPELWAETGFTVAREQFVLKTRAPQKIEATANDLWLNETESNIVYIFSLIWTRWYKN